MGWVLGFALSAAFCGVVVGQTASVLSGRANARLILAHACAVTAYVLLVGLVLWGLWLSHPWRNRVRRPTMPTRIRIHIVLSVFTLAFTTSHVLLVATNPAIKVGWIGALVPMGSVYRPVGTALGVMGLFAGAFAGLTAALAGRLRLRMWWPIHKLASVVWILVWLHCVLAGSDTPEILPLYLVTGALVFVLAVLRYSARSSASQIADLG